MLLGSLMLVVLLIAALYCVKTMLDAQQDARYAAEDLAYCQGVAEEIESLRDVDTGIQSPGDTAEQSNQLARDVAEAGQTLGFADGWFRNINTGSPVPVGDTPYLRQPTVIYLQDLTLGQIAELLHTLTHDSPLSASELRLKAPAGEAVGTRWEAEVTLTYLVYAPNNE